MAKGRAEEAKGAAVKAGAWVLVLSGLLLPAGGGLGGPQSTRIQETLNLAAACTIAIAGGDVTLCEGLGRTFAAEVACDSGFVLLRDPEWFLDGETVGKGLVLQLPPLLAGGHTLRASCGSCQDEIALTVLPAESCIYRPDITAVYSDDATENTAGIFLVPGIAPVTPGSFPELKFLMRPVVVDAAAEAALAAPSVVLVATGGILQLYRTDGTPVPLPDTVGVESLPVTYYLSATATGEGRLVAIYEAGAGGGAGDAGETASAGPAADAADTIRVRAGPFPGLAGKALAGYPYFEFTRVVNDKDTVRTALDPARHAERVGLPYRVYVVRHRTPAEWAASAALVDVSGGTEMATVAAGSIRDNVLAVWPAAPEGGVVGEGYDVVYDFGRDGRLDPGDLIDGLDYGEPGFTVMPDLTLSGPHAVTETIYSGGVWLDQDTYYPSDIASLGQLPLVVISHGYRHQYTWYDYLGVHLASHGYVVMSHSNNVVPGIEAASTTTLTNSDYFLGALGSIGGGVLRGHVDSTRIAFVGHSMGGEGVIRAYARLFDGTYHPVHLTRDGVRLVSSIAPVVYLTPAESDLHEVTYHLIWGSADGDVGGYPSCPQCQAFRHAENAHGTVQVTYVQGASHEDFNCCGQDEGVGPDRIGRMEAQRVARGYYLALMELYLEGNLAMKDFFRRMYDDLRPSGIAPHVVCANQYWEGAAAANGMLDDYQTNPSAFVSSSGGTVSFDVVNLSEGVLDGDDDFTFTPGDAMNGMTEAELSPDNSAGVVFDWTVGEERFYELEVVPALRDFTAYRYLSFRACQGTRHPETVALNGPLSFTVTLRDGAGCSSSIPLASTGTITRPYQRTGYGSGAGWQNEFETVRLRLADFENDGTGLDLRDIRAVRFRFGGPYGSARGRVGLDRIELTRD